MELKMNYQYTYFIHPFVIEEEKYKNYLVKMLKDKNCKLKRFEKDKDFHIYKFFTSKMRKFLFSNFNLTNKEFNELQDLPIKEKANLLATFPCNIFTYEIAKDIQGKAGGEKGIFFKIQKIEVICFKTGICFLAIKTNIDDMESFSNLLNFNYKFRDINQGKSTLNSYDNISIQTDSFDNIENFKKMINSITGSNVDSEQLDIDIERFLIYSYVCIDQKDWNFDNQFEELEHNFIKFANVLPADNGADLKKNEVSIFSKWKYAKIGITKRCVALMASSSDINNYTILPEEFENQYFYTYISALYKRIYLKKLGIECKKNIKNKKMRKKFADFTKNVWIQEVSENEIGTKLNQTFKEAFELDELYSKIKDEYDIMYKELKIEKNAKSTILIGSILVVSLLLNILNFIILLNE